MLTLDDPDRSLQGNDGVSRVEGEDGASFAAEDEPNALGHAVHEAKDHEGSGEEPLEDDAWDADFSEDDERTEDDFQEDEEFPAGTSLAEDDIEGDEEELPVRDVEEDDEPNGSGVRDRAARVVQQARSLVMEHQAASAIIAFALVSVFVIGALTFAFTRVFAYDRGVLSEEREVPENLLPVEHAELPHLGLRIDSISTSAAPNIVVHVRVDALPEVGYPPLAPEQFALSESTGEGEAASVALANFSYDQGTGVCTFSYATPVADAAARRTLSVKLLPESGYRGGCSITYSCA
ncbi:hypothetical protein H6A10_00810 [Enorma massiliensis]|uniref:hypothetical protein n=1 Tax=Enorma massiliensis TaxID=1472761 RepID=UPI00195C168A|nr:hypothetical protein [Enorma massiliensis]MBM6891660.1 hypothetical protein [Enorma massiliensis]